MALDLSTQAFHEGHGFHVTGTCRWCRGPRIWSDGGLHNCCGCVNCTCHAHRLITHATYRAHAGLPQLLADASARVDYEGVQQQAGYEYDSDEYRDDSDEDSDRYPDTTSGYAAWVPDTTSDDDDSSGDDG